MKLDKYPGTTTVDDMEFFLVRKLMKAFQLYTPSPEIHTEINGVFGLAALGDTPTTTCYIGMMYKAHKIDSPKFSLLLSPDNPSYITLGGD